MLHEKLHVPRVTRRAIARVLSTFLCILLVTIHSFSQLGGSSAFLLLSLKELIFSVQEDLAQQIEITVLNITGALISIGVSTFAKYLATVPQKGSVISRLIPAVFLVTISFFGWSPTMRHRSSAELLLMQLAGRRAVFLVSICLHGYRALYRYGC